MTQASVARALGTSETSVSRWYKTYKREGEGALESKPHPGRRSRLTAGQKQRLTELLLEGAGKQGYGTDRWTLTRVTELIAAKFGVKYHPCHVSYVLRSVGWHDERRQRRLWKGDKEAVTLTPKHSSSVRAGQPNGDYPSPNP